MKIGRFFLWNARILKFNFYFQACEYLFCDAAVFFETRDSKLFEEFNNSWWLIVLSTCTLLCCSKWLTTLLSGGRCCTVLRPESSYLRRCVGDGLQGLMGKPACPHGLQCCPCVDTSFLPEPASAASIYLDSSSGADSPLRDPWDLRLPHMTLKPPVEDVRATSSLDPGPLLQASCSACMVPTVAWLTSGTFHCSSGFHV